MSNSKKLSELNKIDGKLHGNEVSIMEKMFNNRGKSIYKATSVAQYEEQLNNMRWDDLHNHALEVGVIPGDIENKSRLKRNLVILFQEYISQLREPPEIETKSNNKNKASQKVMNQVLKNILGS